MAERLVLDDKIGESDCSVDPHLWHACAGSQVQIPKVGSSLIYFPQGHAEHASPSPVFPKGFSISSTIPCRVLSVRFLADAETDEVYARIALLPECADANWKSALDPAPPPNSFNRFKAASFAKTLTQSDANNGGGFSVPRYCAETIFPRLNYSKDPPVQNVHARDVHGKEWTFRHIYRGTPRRHLLTTGWSNFVNQKRLVAGDVIVFLREANGKLCVGVRRSLKSTGARDSSISCYQISSAAAPSTFRTLTWESKPNANSIQRSCSFLERGQCLSSLSRSSPDIALAKHTFARNRARVSSNSVLEAATLAASGKPFEVVFYPINTTAEFCVSAKSVRASLQQVWALGMRFKMAVETEDASRLSWFMGTVSKVQEIDPVLWPNSPWKMLEVSWDEPDMLQGITRVSPWQVEVVPPMQLPLLSLSKKKSRISQPTDLSLDEIDYLTAASALNGQMPGLEHPWHGPFNSSPAGMQGARHDRNCGFSFQAPTFPSTNILLDNAYRHQDFQSMGELVATAGSEGIVQELLQHGCEHVQNPLKAKPSRKGDQPQQPCGVASDIHGVPGKKPTFMLFGKTIDASQSFNQQQVQVQSDNLRHEAISDGFNLCGFHRFLQTHGQ